MGSDTARGNAIYETSQEVADLNGCAVETLDPECTHWDERYGTCPSLEFLVAGDVDVDSSTDLLGATIDRSNEVPTFPR